MTRKARAACAAFIVALAVIALASGFAGERLDFSSSLRKSSVANHNSNASPNVAWQSPEEIEQDRQDKKRFFDALRSPGKAHLAPARPAPLHFGPRIRLFFSTTSQEYLYMLRIAALSSRDVGFIPNLVLQAPGVPQGAEQLAKELSIPISFRESQWKTQLRKALELSGRDQSELSVIMGTFARFEVPLIAASQTLNKSVEWITLNIREAAEEMEKQSMSANAVLYTDCDVVFLRSMALELSKGRLKMPNIFAAAGENNASAWDVLNSGVMLFNVSGYLAAFAEMNATLHDNGFKCFKEAYDQGCLQYLNSKMHMMDVPTSRLSPCFNWKPYWTMPLKDFPDCRDPYIVHLHGNKIRHMWDRLARESSRSVRPQMPGAYDELWRQNPSGHLQALKLWLDTAMKYIDF